MKKLNKKKAYLLNGLNIEQLESISKITGRDETWILDAESDSEHIIFFNDLWVWHVDGIKDFDKGDRKLVNALELFK